ncbi:hypothetical protein L1D31_22075 [Vibrio sp. Isolate23]|uniref:hypothetical protein n=1 Tax=Vibrio sp. Isolate23 TaxID=2908533 RepID=UPI001EFE5152|nr:hypothetical protein [Vibrio sp. Isolate23]MCG9685208.1 hypothetical protein [Vibrio sp. Isolate23]
MDSIELISVVNTQKLPAGVTMNLDAVGTYSDGTVKLITPDADWALESQGDEPETRLTENGFAIKGNFPMTVKVIASKDGKASEKVIDITAAQLMEVKVIPSGLTMPNAARYQYKLVGEFSDGQEFDLPTDEATWQASDTSVADVSDGLLTTLSSGQADVFVNYKGVGGIAKVDVVPAKPTGLVISGHNLTLTQNSDYQFNAYVSYDNGSMVDVTNSSQWHTTNPAVADFSGANFGKLSANSTGTTRVSAAYTDPGTGTAMTSNTINVSVNNDLLALTLSVADNMPVNTKQHLFAELVFANGDKQVVTDSVNWVISDTQVLEKTGPTEITAKSAGTVELSGEFCSATGQCVQTRKVNIQVDSATLVDLSVSPATGTMVNNTTAEFSAIGRFSDNTLRDVSQNVNFRSDNDLVAQFTGNILTSYQATAPSSPLGFEVCHQSSGVCTQGQVNIVQKQLSHLTIYPSQVSAIASVPEVVSASAVYNDGTTQDVTDLVSWTNTHSDGSFITTASGLKAFQAGSAGTADITATFQGHSVTNPVTVSNASITALSLTPARLDLHRGIPQSVSVIASLNDGSSKDVTDFVSWEPSSRDIYQDGTKNKLKADVLLTGEEVKARYSGLESQAVPVNVQSVPLKRLVASPSTVDVLVGTTESLAVHAVFENGDIVDVTDDIAWQTVSNEFSVTNKRVLTGLSAVADAKLWPLHSSYPGAQRNEVSVTVSDITPTHILSGLADVVSYTDQAWSLHMTAVMSDGSTRDITAAAQVEVGDLSLAEFTQGKLVIKGAVGTTSYTIKWLGMSATYSLEVQARQVIDLLVYPSPLNMLQSETAELTVRAVLNGDKVIDLATFNTVSSDSSIATVQNASKVIASNVGSTVLTVTDPASGVSKDVPASVVAHPQTLELSQYDITLMEGASAQLRASYDDGANVTDMTYGAIWNTSDANLANVTSGQITAQPNTAGRDVYVSAEVFGRRSSTATINIVNHQSLPPCSSGLTDSMCQASVVGGTGGTARAPKMCDTREVITGFTIRTSRTDVNYPGKAIAAHCSTLYINARNEVKLSEGQELVFDSGTDGYDNEVRLECPDDQLLVGLKTQSAPGGPAGRILANMKLICSSVKYNEDTRDLDLTGTLSESATFLPAYSHGQSNLQEQQSNLGSQQVILGYQVYTGTSLDSIRFYGAPLDMAVAP